MKKFLYYILNFFSHNMENKIIQICKPKEKLVIFDVGCFKGVFSRKILNLLENKKYIFHLFDINKNTRKYIPDLISIKNIFYNEIALSNKNGKAIYNFNRFFESSGSSLSKLYRNDNRWVTSRKLILKFFFQNTKDYTQYKVRTTTLDNFVKRKNIKFIDILKVDIDGSEYDFLQGAKNTFKKNKVKVILIEINAKKNNFYKKEQNIIKFFNRKNYSLIKKHINHTVSFFSNAKSGDYLFVKKAS